jgi:DNA-binding NarL/FixJ family response regulator
VQKTWLMIVEDESLTAMSLKKRLQKQGYEVVAVAPSGEEAGHLDKMAIGKGPQME